MSRGYNIQIEDIFFMDPLTCIHGLVYILTITSSYGVFLEDSVHVVLLFPDLSTYADKYTIHLHSIYALCEFFLLLLWPCGGS